MNEIILSVQSLYPNEAEILVEVLNKIILDPKKLGSFISVDKTQKCNCCGGKIYKNGTTKYGRQKYICKNCKITFSDSTDSFLFHSTLTYTQIAQLLYCEYTKQTLKETASTMGISKTSAFNNRHKLYKTIEEKNLIYLTEEVEIDGKFVSINLKGTQKNKMPRLSKQRGKGSSKRGVSNHKVCIMTVVDSHDNIVLNIVGTGSETNEMVETFCNNHFFEVTSVISDCKTAFETYCKNNNIRHMQIKSGTYKDNFGNILSKINSLHSEIEFILSKRRGVSTKHLQSYLNMLVYFKTLNYKIEEKYKKNKILKDCTGLTRKTKVKDISSGEFPIDIFKVYAEYNYQYLN